MINKCTFDNGNRMPDTVTWCTSVYKDCWRPAFSLRVTVLKPVFIKRERDRVVWASRDWGVSRPCLLNSERKKTDCQQANEGLWSKAGSTCGKYEYTCRKSTRLCFIILGLFIFLERSEMATSSDEVGGASDRRKSRKAVLFNDETNWSGNFNIGKEF